MWLAVPWTPTSPVVGRAVLPIRILNFIFLLGVFAVNGLASSGFIGNRTTKEVSDIYYTYLTPAGYAFTIWGLIYLALAVWGIYQLLPRSYNDDSQNKAVGYLWLINAAANMGWIVAWHHLQMWLALLLMFIILGTLATIFYRLSAYDPPATYAAWWIKHFPFSIYLAWIIGASIINHFAATTNTREEQYVYAGIVGLLLAGIVESYIAILRLDPVITAVGCWAVAAIAVNFGSGGPQPEVRIQQTAIAVATVLAVVTVAVFGVRMWFAPKWAEAQREAKVEDAPSMHDDHSADAVRLEEGAMHEKK